MAMGLSETISFREPRPPEELGGDITRKCIELLERRDIRFAKVLTGGRIFENVSTALARYLERLEEAHPDEVVQAVSVMLHDDLMQLGIGRMRCHVESLNGGDEPLRLADETKSPTVVVIPEGDEGYQPIVACSRVDSGGEELEALTENLCLRGYLPGDNPRGREVALQPVKRGDKVLVPQNTTLGVRIPIHNEARTSASGFYLSSLRITRDELRDSRFPGQTGAAERKPDFHEPGQVYLCRYLTKEAVRQALGL